MERRCRRVWSWLLCIAPVPVAGFSSTTTYHLHKVSTTSLLQLKTNAREPAITVLFLRLLLIGFPFRCSSTFCSGSYPEGYTNGFEEAWRRDRPPSVATSKPAMCGHFKTGHMKRR